MSLDVLTLAFWILRRATSGLPTKHCGARERLLEVRVLIQLIKQDGGPSTDFIRQFVHLVVP